MWRKMNFAQLWDDWVRFETREAAFKSGAKTPVTQNSCPENINEESGGMFSSPHSSAQPSGSRVSK